MSVLPFFMFKSLYVYVCLDLFIFPVYLNTKPFNADILALSCTCAPICIKINYIIDSGGSFRQKMIKSLESFFRKLDSVYQFWS